jgi:hypothetical protein
MNILCTEIKYHFFKINLSQYDYILVIMPIQYVYIVAQPRSKIPG